MAIKGRGGNPPAGQAYAHMRTPRGERAGGGDGLPYTMTQFCDAQDGTRPAVFGITTVSGITYKTGALLVFVQHGSSYNHTQGN